MGPGLWDRIGRVFEAALERAPAEREAFLRGECAGDEALRAAVDRLLAEDERATYAKSLDPALTPLLEATRPKAVACPRCGGQVDVSGQDQPFRELTCPACGSTFEVDGLAEAPWGPDRGAHRVGRFELMGVVGSGSFGTVYRARDTELDRHVALKVLRAGGLATDDERARFLREARNAARLRHPSIVAVHEVGEQDGVPYLVSEFIEGVTLSAWLSAGTHTFREMATMVAQVADALQFAHEHGVIHRDVKPSNVMIDRLGRPHLMDFGLARRDEGDATLTLEGAILGTPSYMSPEQARGEVRRVDGRSDVYSLGVVFYRMLAGEPPFRGQLRMLVHQLIHDEPRPPRSLNDRVPIDLQTTCLKAMAKESSRRYATAGEMAADLRRWLAGEPIRARPVGPLTQSWLWCRRRPALAGLLGAVVALVLALITGLAYNDRASRIALRVQSGLRAKADQRLDQMIASYRANLERLLSDPRLLRPVDRDATLELIEGPRKLFEDLAAELSSDPEAGRKRRTNLVQCLEQLVAIEVALDRPREAIDLLDQVVRVDRSLLADDEGDVDVRVNLASACNRKGNALRELGAGREEPAECAYRDAIAEAGRALERLGDHAPARDTLAASHNNLANLLKDTGRQADTEGQYEAALDEYQRLVDANPDVPSYRSHMATALTNRGIDLRKAGEEDQALAHFQRAIQGLLTPGGADPTALDAKDLLAQVYTEVGITVKPRDPAAAMAADRRAVEVREALVRLAPRNARYREGLAKSYNGLANAARQAQRLDEALPMFELSMVHFLRLVQDHPEGPSYRADLKVPMNSVFQELRRLRGPGTLDRSALAHERVLGAFESLAVTDPDVEEFLVGLGRARYNMACLRSRQFQWAPAEEVLATQAVAYLRLARAATNQVAGRDFVTQDPDLKPIRDRDDFLAFLADLDGPNDPVRRPAGPTP
jgi:serine/threonine protein kinase